MDNGNSTLYNYRIALFQDMNQSTPKTGWFWHAPDGSKIPHDPLTSSFWGGSEPGDGGDGGVENNEENTAMLDRGALQDYGDHHSKSVLCMFSPTGSHIHNWLGASLRMTSVAKMQGWQCQRPVPLPHRQIQTVTWGIWTLLKTLFTGKGLKD